MTVTKDPQLTKKDRQINQLIIHNLIEVIELYPLYRIGQHLSYIMDKENSYNWNNETLLKHLEQYKDKLESEYEDDNEF